jgi:predicted PurR-regulated permease PerM
MMAQKFDPDSVLKQLVVSALTVFIAVIVLLGVLVFRQVWIQQQIVAVSDDLQENVYELEEVTGELQNELDAIQTTDNSEAVEETIDDITSLLDDVDDQLDTVGDDLNDVALVLEPEPETVNKAGTPTHVVQQDSMDEMFTIFAVLIGLTSIMVGILLGIAIRVQQIPYSE